MAGLSFVARMGRYCSIPRVAYGSDLPRFIDPEIDKAVFTERKSIVSNILRGPTSGRWVVMLSTPVVNERNEVAYSVQLILPAEYFEVRVATTAITGAVGSLQSMIEKVGSLLARSITRNGSVSRWLRRAGTSPKTSLAVRVVSGVILKTLEGRAVEGAYYRMISTGWLVGSAAPSEVYNAPLRQALLLIGAVTIFCSPPRRLWARILASA